MNDYDRGRRAGLIEAMRIWCPWCEDEDDYPVEYVEQLGEWFHRMKSGKSSKCSADRLRKLIKNEGFVFDEEPEDNDMIILRPALK